MKTALIASVIGLFFTAAEAEAALFDFSYVADTGVLTGRFSGQLQSDFNTIVITRILDFAAWDGVEGPSLPFLQSTDAYYLGASGLLPTVTRDKSFFDFIACPDSSCLDGFTFNAGNAASVIFANGSPSWGSGASFGNVGIAPFDPAAWTLTPVGGAIPVPPTLALLAIGGSVLVWRRKRPV